MDINPTPTEKKVKAPTKTSSIRVKKETRKRILQELARANKKDYGRKIRADEYISLAISKITPADVKKLQEESLSNSDRLDSAFRDYSAKHGPISKDEFLGKMMRGELTDAARKEEVPNAAPSR